MAHVLYLGDGKFQQVAPASVSEEVKFVNDDQTKGVHSLLLQESIDDPIGFLNSANGDVDGLEATRRVVAAHETTHSDTGVL